MFFDNNVAVKVIDVMRISRRKKISFATPKRDFSVISYRKKGHTIFSKSGNYYEAANNSISFVPQNISYSQTSENEELIVIHFEIFGKFPKTISVFYPEIYEDYELLFEKILNAWENKDTGYALKCNSVLNELMYMTEKEMFRKNANYDFSVASRAAAIIERHLGDACFSLSEISGILNLSDAYLRGIFKSKYKVTLKEYQTSCRLKRARMLLETKYLPIKEVAHQCGFENEKYFSALFKKHFGISPKQYKYSL